MFVRNARKVAAESAETAIQSGTQVYASQRATRMAKRTVANKDELNMLNYQVYGEWTAPLDLIKSQTIETEPTYIMQVDVCPWYVVCKEYGYLKELEEYCKTIDKTLVKVYNSQLSLDINGIKTFGAKGCTFVWNGLKMDDETQKIIAEKRKELGLTCKKDWEYHTKHMYSAMSSEMLKLPCGQEIINNTLKDFEDMFGKKMKDIVIDCKNINFYEI